MAHTFRRCCRLFLQVLTPTIVILGCGGCSRFLLPSLPPPPAAKNDPGPPTALKPINK